MESVRGQNKQQTSKAAASEHTEVVITNSFNTFPVETAVISW